MRTNRPASRQKADAPRVADEIGIAAGVITQLEVLSQRHGHRVWRVHLGADSLILKWFPDESSASAEIGAYALLKELAIPTLSVHGTAPQAILLEDLAASSRWRSASEEDLANPEVGTAIGRWYKMFHDQGSRLLNEEPRRAAFLRRETEILNEQRIMDAAKALDLADNPAWRVAS